MSRQVPRHVLRDRQRPRRPPLLWHQDLPNRVRLQGY